MRLIAEVNRHKRRWVEHGLPDYPLWFAALIDSSALLTAVVALVQRRDDVLLPAVLLVLVALAPWALEIWAMGNAWPAFVVLTGGSAAVLMVALPVDYEVVPFLLILMTGHVTAVAGVWRGTVVMLAGQAVILLVWSQGHMAGPVAAIWAVAVLVGVDLGFIVRTQQRRIEAQVREHAVRERQAVLEERQRVAREVHDLVGHSLSVTMLHLTAARREVEDAAAGEGDLAEAVEALTEAEAVGRRAMADIRGTVAMLAADDVPAAGPTPGLDELRSLVADFQRAGVDVTWESRGELTDVPPATALGLFRIVQESLANVAKHAPRAAARVRLDLDGDPGTLQITSELPRGGRRTPGGSGLHGMATRAEQLGARLTAGPEDGDWVVRLELPASGAVA